MEFHPLIVRHAVFLSTAVFVKTERSLPVSRRQGTTCRLRITLRLTRWKLLFSEDELAGTVTVDGVEYVKNDGWRTPNYFYTTPYPGDGTAHIVIPQEVLDWRQNYILLVLEGKKATLSYSNLLAKKIATYVFSVEDSK